MYYKLTKINKYLNSQADAISVQTLSLSSPPDIIFDVANPLRALVFSARITHCSKLPITKLAFGLCFCSVGLLYGEIS